MSKVFRFGPEAVYAQVQEEVNYSFSGHVAIGQGINSREINECVNDVIRSLGCEQEEVSEVERDMLRTAVNNALWDLEGEAA